MVLTSIRFVLFAALLLAVYYAVPQRQRWWVLLAGSLCFYALAGLKNVIYILITAASTYLAARGMQTLSARQKARFKADPPLSKEEKAACKAKTASRRRAILVLTLVLNFGILCGFKYAAFALAQVSGLVRLFGGEGFSGALHLIVPLGISFYTFQTMGYLIDVYWKKVEAQPNFAKLLLFVSFFPQITQGPISDYAQLSEQLFTPHTYSYEAFKSGGIRMIWGFAKKLILADLLAPWVADVFANYETYAGITVLIGAFFYSIQIYADFSGYMDIVCGLCEMLGIRLTENFDRPYFSKSIAEYWRRWHISLGAWFKTYLYYPIAVAKWNQRLGKRAQKRFGKYFGQTLPASLALVAVWVTTGLWHGASWAYIAWGAVNGIFIIFSLWMEPVYAAVRRKLHVSDSRWLWRAFRTLRTFFLVTLIKVLPEVGTLRQGLGLWKRIFTNFTVPTSLSALLPFAAKRELLLVGLFTAALLLTGLIQRRRPVRQWFGGWPRPLRLLTLAVLILAVLFYGSSGNAGGFLYAQF